MDWGLPKDLCAYQGGCTNRRLAGLCPGHKNLGKVTEQKKASALPTPPGITQNSPSEPLSHDMASLPIRKD